MSEEAQMAVLRRELTRTCAKLAEYRARLKGKPAAAAVEAGQELAELRVELAAREEEIELLQRQVRDQRREMHRMKVLLRESGRMTKYLRERANGGSR